MRGQISYTVLGFVLLAGTAAANAQTVLPQSRVAVPPGTILAQSGQVVDTVPVETVETVQTVEPARRITRHPAMRSRPAVVTTTTRRIVRERVLPTQTVVAPLAEPTYDDMALSQPVGAAPLYDVVAPPAWAPPGAAPPMLGAAVVGQPVGFGAPMPAYRYVYEPDRILVIDQTTGIAVQAIPR